MDRDAFVYVDLDGVPQLVGRLWTKVRTGKERATLEYDAQWLRHHARFSLEPALTLGEGAFHTEAGIAMFGAIGDSAPDRWGRTLMRRMARREAERQGHAVRTLFEMDYLLMVDDEARQGALRFSAGIGTPFLREHDDRRIPPLIELPRLLAAAERVIDDEDTDEDLRLLFAPGSSLGGARPKASVRLGDGSLAIAKFPRRDDDHDTVRWERVALVLAERAGITVPTSTLEPVAGKPVLIVRRFDRRGSHRVPFLSAMSMLGAKDNETHSYLEIVDALRQHGAVPAEDLQQLWRRIVFNVLISNTDDHLRNHAFLYDGQRGWQLSPAYDLNPVPTDLKARMLMTTITESDNTASLDLVMSVAGYFRIKPERAREISREVASSVSQWRIEASRSGLSRSQIDRMASAFEHRDMDQARTM